jgi:hypothetical protein
MTRLPPCPTVIVYSHQVQRARQGQTELPGCTGAVVDDHLLAEVRSQFLPDQAGEYVGRVSGWEWDDDTYRPLRIFAGDGSCHRQCCPNESKQFAAIVHFPSLQSARLLCALTPKTADWHV